MYFDKLSEEGLLALHISNRYLDLEPVLGKIGQDLQLVCRINEDDDVSQGSGQRRPERFHLGSDGPTPGNPGRLAPPSRLDTDSRRPRRTALDRRLLQYHLHLQVATREVTAGKVLTSLPAQVSNGGYVFDL